LVLRVSWTGSDNPVPVLQLIPALSRVVATDGDGEDVPVLALAGASSGEKARRVALRQGSGARTIARPSAADLVAAGKAVKVR
jgi:hypothetical protein